jgi:hypothetical protein
MHPERSNKFELNEKIHFDTMELLYAHITQLVVEGSELARILAQLMLQTAISKEQTGWQTFPKNRKGIIIQQQLRAKYYQAFQRWEMDLGLHASHE